MTDDELTDTERAELCADLRGIFTDPEVNLQEARLKYTQRRAIQIAPARIEALEAENAAYRAIAQAVASLPIGSVAILATKEHITEVDGDALIRIQDQARALLAKEAR